MNAFLEPLNKDHDMTTENTTAEDQGLTATMTPERRKYEEASLDMGNRIQSAGQYMQQTVQAIAASGVVVTMQTEPLQPLAMGHYTLGINCRLTRSAQQHLDALEAAAIASEAPQEIEPAGDMSFVGESLAQSIKEPGNGA